MGLLVLNYTTNEGFLIPEMYIIVNCIRMLKTLSGPSYGMVYTSVAYKSVDDKDNGFSPVAIPTYLTNVEEFLTADQFYNQTIFGFAYDAIKRAWEAQGYTVQDYYPHPPTPTTFIYDCSGYNYQGFNCAGYDREGYDKQGFNAAGWDRQGYGRDGYNAAGYDRQGFNRQGYDIDGYNRQGYNAEGYDRQGYDIDGYNAEGYDRQGYDRDGYNAAGYDHDGYDREGYNADGYDRQGCNRQHLDISGNPCPSQPAPAPGPTDLSGSPV